MPNALGQRTTLGGSCDAVIVERNCYDVPPQSLKRASVTHSKSYTTYPWKREERYDDIEVNGLVNKEAAVWKGAQVGD